MLKAILSKRAFGGEVVSIFAKAVLRYHGADDSRLVWCCDSFEGMPTPNAEDLATDANSDFSDRDYLSVSLESVKHNFQKFDLLDRQRSVSKGLVQRHASERSR